MRSDVKRPASYSDSYIVLAGTNVQLEPLFPEIHLEPIEPAKPAYFNMAVLFVIKGSLHILFISAFETFFYFFYVSKSENNGIIGTINTYYTPLVQSCNSWSNLTKTVVMDLLKVDKSTVDEKGDTAAAKRNTYNLYLMNWSIAYSVICFGVFVTMLGIVYLRKITVKWKELFQEHLAFVLVLGIYEYFFFRTIIYNYTTISTDELNKYIVDGLYQCSTDV
jgi:hypothetical protein